MGALREILAFFSVNVDTGKLKSADKDVDGFKSKLGEVATFLGGAALVAGAKSFVDGQVEAAETLTRTSEQLGIGAQDLQRWQYAAGQAGVESSSVATSLKFLEKNMSAAGAAGAKTGGAFQDLKVDVRDAKGEMRPVADVMKDVGAKISSLKSPADRTGASLKIFGRQGLALAPLFAKGNAALEQTFKDFDELGGGVSEDARKKLVELAQAEKQFGVATESVKASIASALIPYLTKAVGFMTGFIVTFAKSKEGASLLRSGLIVLGVVAAVVGATILLPWVPFAIAIGFAIGLVDSLTAAMKGQKSVLGGLFSFLNGGDNKHSIFVEMNDDLISLNATLSKTPGFGNKVAEVFSQVGASITSFALNDVPAAVEQLSKNVWAGGASTGEKWAYGILNAFAPVLFGNDLITKALEYGKALVSAIGQGISAGADVAEQEISNMLAAGVRSGRVAAHLLSADAAAVETAGDEMQLAHKKSQLANISIPAVFQGPVNPLADVAGKTTHVVNHNSVPVTNTVTVTIQGNADGDDVKDGVSRGLFDANHAAVHALENVAPAKS